MRKIMIPLFLFCMIPTAPAQDTKTPKGQSSDWISKTSEKMGKLHPLLDASYEGYISIKGDSQKLLAEYEKKKANMTQEDRDKLGDFYTLLHKPPKGTP